MKLSENPGLVFSSAAHVVLLAAMLMSFSSDPKFQDAQETIPVEIMSSSDVNQIMKGDKTAKEVRPKQRADKVADTTGIKPKPPLAEAKKDVPTPPSPDKKLPDPGTAEKPPEKPVQADAPAQAAQAKPEPPKPEPKPDPKPPVALAPQEDAAAEPLPPTRPKDPPPKKEVKKVEVKKPEPKLRLDQIAKLLEEKKKAEAKPAKPKSGDDSPDKTHKFDPSDISRVLLSHETPQRKAATNRQLEQIASLGSPTASAPVMSPSLMAQMDGWFQDQFQGCWTQPITIPPGQKYVPRIRVPLNLDGSLAAEPTLLNPPSDPAWRPLAESALRAVRKCDPLPVPARFKAYYEEWRGRVVQFDDQAL